MAISDALATLTTPQARPSINRIRLNNVTIDRPTTTVRVALAHLDTDDGEQGIENIVISEAAEVVAFVAAIGTARANETGSVPRRFNFRVLGHLVDTGKLTGVTVAP